MLWHLGHLEREREELCMCGTHLGRALQSMPNGVVPYICFSLFFLFFSFSTSLFHTGPHCFDKCYTMKQLIISNELIIDEMHGMHGFYLMQDELM